MAQIVKNPPTMQDTWVRSLDWEGPWGIPWDDPLKWQFTLEFLPGESLSTEGPGGLQPMGSQRVGHDWVAKHSTTYMASLVVQLVENPPNMHEIRVQSLGWKDPGEGNGNPLQYPCLENPMDRGAWKAAVHSTARVGHAWETKPGDI